MSFKAGHVAAPWTSPENGHFERGDLPVPGDHCYPGPVRDPLSAHGNKTLPAGQVFSPRALGKP